MKLYNYLETIITNPKVIEEYILPTLKNKTTFWVPLRKKNLSSLQPKKLKAFHQISLDYLNQLLNIKKNISISTFTNISTDSIKNLLDKSIGSGSGLIVLVKGSPIISSPKDVISRREQNRKWINFAKNIDYEKGYKSIKEDVIKKINTYLNGKDPLSFDAKEKNRFIAFYHKTVWDTIKEKNHNDANYYKHLSFSGPIKDLLLSKASTYKKNTSNSSSYNEVIMNNIKVLKVYYDPNNFAVKKDFEKIKKEINKSDNFFIPIIDKDKKINNEFLLDLKEISNQ